MYCSRYLVSGMQQAVLPRQQGSCRQCQMTDYDFLFNACNAIEQKTMPAFLPFQRYHGTLYIHYTQYTHHTLITRRQCMCIIHSDLIHPIHLFHSYLQRIHYSSSIISQLFSLCPTLTLSNHHHYPHPHPHHQKQTKST